MDTLSHNYVHIIDCPRCRPDIIQMDMISVFVVVSEVSIDQAFHFSERCCRVLMPVSSPGVSSRCEDEQSMFGRYSTLACHRNDRRLLLVKRDCVYLTVRGRE